jgi:CubicO group peptidase (beta-lactamase class C family)
MTDELAAAGFETGTPANATERRTDSIVYFDEAADDPDAAAADPRLYDITVRQLLNHTAGWDHSSQGFDPTYASHLVADHLDVPLPVSCAQIVRFMLAQQLDSDPGERFAYSNFGYCVLGRIIEAVTGQPYEAYVTQNILGPIGITRMRIGSTSASAAADGEVQYYGYPGQPMANTVISDDPETVPWPYGGFNLEARAAQGGWVASVLDLVRFAVSVDGRKPPAVLSPATVETMLAAPDLWSGSSPAYYYALGWSVRPVADEANWWHYGSLPGTSSLLVRTHHGMVWSVLFNSRPRDRSRFIRELDALMWRGLSDVTDWPSHDFFEHYGYE